MEFEKKAVVCSDYIEMVHKIDIKGEPWWPEESTEVKLLSEEPLSLNNNLGNNIITISSEENSNIITSRSYEAPVKTEIKEEPSWLDKTGAEMKCDTEEAMKISDLSLLNNIKKRFAQIKSKSENVTEPSFSTFQDDALEVYGAVDPPAIETPRHNETTFNKDSAVSTYLTSRHSETAKCLNVSKQNSECEDGEDVTEASHTGKPTYKCVRCGRRYLYASQLERHILVHEGKGACTCTFCGKSFSQYSYLNQHCLMHEGKGLYKCKICQKNFSKLSNLKAHSLIHEGTKPFSCDICKQSFNNVYAIKRHKLVHEGKRSHKCEVCEKSFIQLSDLNRHKLIHEGKKPFTCEICQRSFTQCSSLKMHRRVHRHKHNVKNLL